jgi:protein-tyrosine-phosphatase
MIFQTVIFNGKYAPRGYRAISPGTRLASQINPLAVKVMNEVGLDTSSSQKPKIITEDISEVQKSQ